jgi:hypothetical protein
LRGERLFRPTLPFRQTGGGLVLCDGQADALRFVLKPGGKFERVILVENRSAKPITITSFETSCDCTNLETPLSELVFPPNERRAIRIVADMAKDGEYRGRFSPQISLYQGKDVVLTTEIGIEVNE